MGKIFGISDNPVSTIESALKPLTSVSPKRYSQPIAKNTDLTDKFVSIEKQNKPNAIVKMRNGFGKLMSHFSHPKKNT